MSFSSYLHTVAPWYMSTGRMSILLDSVGQMLEGLAERSFLGRLAAMPYAGGTRSSTGVLMECETDVLPVHARDREITLYPSEPILSQRISLSRWHQLHARRATHRGEMERVQTYFLGADGLGVLPRIRIVHQDGDGDGAMWHTLSGSYDPGGAGVYSIHRKLPSNWDFDGNPDQWSRWWGILYTEGIPFLNAITHWDDGSLWDGGQVWDGVLMPNKNDIISIFLSWTAAHSQCAGIILARDLASFNPTALPVVAIPEGYTTLPIGNWGNLVDPGTGLPTRLPTATWIYDRYY